MGKIDDAFRKAEKLQETKQSTPLSYGHSLVDFTNTNSPLVESYRTLRTNIQRKSRVKAIRSILMASATNGEGRTQTVANLAVVFSAIEGNKTLLIDADLRNPELHEIFGVGDGPGLSELLHGTTTLDEIIRPTNVQNLQLVTSGRTLHGSSELFNSQKMGEMITALKAKYDFVLFDSPPVIPYTDAIVLSNHVDGILLVVQARETRREVVRRAKELLNQSEDKFMGVVLNRVEYVIPRSIYEKL